MVQYYYTNNNAISIGEHATYSTNVLTNIISISTYVMTKVTLV